MKISIVFTEGIKQIMMTPETDHEREALKYITPTDSLNVVSKFGDWGIGDEHVSYNIAKCQGGYYRPFPEKDSLMFVIEPQKETEPKKP